VYSELVTISADDGLPPHISTDPLADYDWESLWTGLSERSYSVNESQPNAFPSYNTDTYAGRLLLLQDCQNFFSDIVSDNAQDVDGFFLKSNVKATIESTEFELSGSASFIGHTFDSLKTYTGLTSGFPRYVNDVLQGYGVAQNGDDITADTINNVILFFDECIYPFVTIRASADADHVDYVSFEGNRTYQGEYWFGESAVSYADAINNIAYNSDDSTATQMKGYFNQFNQGGGTPYYVDSSPTKSTHDTIYTESSPPFTVTSLNLYVYERVGDWGDFDSMAKTGFGSITAPSGSSFDYYAREVTTLNPSDTYTLKFDAQASAVADNTYWDSDLYVGAKLNVTFSTISEA